MEVSSNENKVTQLLSKLEVIIKRFSKNHNLDIKDEEELRSSTYLILSEACENVFICKKFFGPNENTTQFLKEYMIPRMREWLAGYLNIKANESCVLDVLSSDPERLSSWYTPSNNESLDIKKIANILSKLSEEDRIYMLNTLYSLKQGNIVLFRNRDLSKQLIPVLHNYFACLQAALNKQQLKKH